MVQVVNYKTIGMQRDNSESAFDSKFAFENMNMRVTARESNTLLSLSNERGNLEMTIVNSSDVVTPILGYPIGNIVLNENLILFTTMNLTDGLLTDRIYKITKSVTEGKLVSTILYSGTLHFDVLHPIECLPFYENENIQKVYWVDGKNQPRFINVADTTPNYNDDSFDFIQNMSFGETVNITKNTNSMGVFPIGTVQYVCTYFNKNGVETSPFYVSSLYYTSKSNRGGSAEENSNSSFTIQIINPQINFDYIRVYSVIRTSINSTPIVKKIQDIPSTYTNYTFHTFGSDSEISIDYLDIIDSTGLAFDLVTFNANPALNVYTPKTPAEIVAHVFTSGQGVRVSGSFTGNFAPPSGGQYFQIIDGSILLSVTDTNSNYISGNTFIFYNEETPMNLEINNYVTGTFQSFQITDTNTVGELQTSTSLLYKGGNKIIPQTIAQKDNVLFFGNIELTTPTVGNKIVTGTTTIEQLVESVGAITFAPKELYTEVGKDVSYPYIPHTLIDGQRASTSFKGGEYYRFGVQFQHTSGQWSEVLFVKDVLNTLYPTTNPSFGIAYDGYPINQVTVSGVQATMSIYTGLITDTLLSLGYKKVRGVVVYPKVYERRVIAQGFLNPTLFNVDDRYNNAPSNINSWFLRPMDSQAFINEGITYLTGNIAEFRHNKPLPTGTYGNAEIQCADRTPISPFIDIANPNIENGLAFKNYFGGQFFVDQSVQTFNSPELEFDTDVQVLNNTELNLQIIGLSHLTGSESNIDLATSTGSFQAGGGFLKPQNLGIKNYGGSHVGVAQDGTRTLMSAPLWYDKARSPSGTGVYFYFKTYPWHSVRSLIDGDSTYALLSRKNMSNVRYSGFNTYLTTPWTPTYGIAPISIVTDSEDTIHKITNIDNYSESELLYKGTINKIVNPDLNYRIYGVDCGSTFDISNADYEEVPTMINNTAITSGVNIKYKTNSHAVIAFNWKNTNTQIVAPRLNNLNTSVNAVGGKPFWEDTLSITVEQDTIDIHTNPIGVTDRDTPYGGVWLAELYRDVNTSLLFGGTNKSAYQNNSWYVAGDAVDINNTNLAAIPLTTGDTYVQRYDCLRVYPYAIDDFQTMTEIVSVLCETKINLDGRYDNNRNSANNLAMTPANFNLLNPIYNQEDNYYQYHALDYDLMSLNKFPNTITWGNKKLSGELTDAWTNILMANTYDVNGEYGEIRALVSFNDALYGFQDKSTFNILYNSRVQVNASDGVPIEISNSGAMDGVKYLSTNAGTKNKHSIITTPFGIYYIDEINRSINIFNGQTSSLTDKLGFHSWANKSFVNLKDWSPVSYDNFTTHFDNMNKDIYFINKTGALCYSELLGQFTSFFSYENVPYMFNNWDNTFAIKRDTTSSTIKIWEQNKGEYNKYFGATKPFYTTLMVNPHPQYDKVFNTFEFRADSWSTTDNWVTPIYPQTLTSPTLNRVVDFTKLKVWDEYQVGEQALVFNNGFGSSLKQKFRSWRTFIPRVVSKNYTALQGGVVRTPTITGLDRLRNNWAYMQLYSEGTNNYQTVLHDINIYYSM